MTHSATGPNPELTATAIRLARLIRAAMVQDTNVPVALLATLDVPELRLLTGMAIECVLQMGALVESADGGRHPGIATTALAEFVRRFGANLHALDFTHDGVERELRANLSPYN